MHHFATTSVFYLLNLILGKSTICLENIDSNKIRGEGVFYNLTPLRSASSYFYILQLFSTDTDVLIQSRLYPTRLWTRRRTQCNTPKRLLRVLNIIECPSPNCYMEGNPASPLCVAKWGRVIHMLPPTPTSSKPPPFNPHLLQWHHGGTKLDCYAPPNTLQSPSPIPHPHPPLQI